MPFIRGDASAFDEMLEELGPDIVSGSRPTDDFEYQAAKAKLKPKDLGARGKLIADALRAAGASAFRVRYDGGFDEGFSHADAILFDQRARTTKAVLKEISSPTLIAALREAFKKDKWAADWLKTASDLEVIQNALDELAHAIASTLLGDGFGTGEYQLYGALTADLKTGEITDDEKARRPAGMK
jgi:hypothetical protein